ncbi:DUF3368 domain-containing protein [Synechocystis sp. PCC 7339]|uniref:DUF3368 domain-containing protein n=1 Tax=Synechocystis sp. PCC 7339 TaxID=2782213 RepID=UPI001CBAD989|nr:DUF3368 domain-containing protein [Synechocystis sp. PCC 7339]UAJ73115.1 DUF3368 domain-containing protein [Synechocystis sp. PCC 7339]
MIVVSDTSAIANLAVVDHFWLLQATYKSVVIPEAVASEIAVATNPKISLILQLDWIQTRLPSPPSYQLAEQLQRERGLDYGEAHAIALALDLQADDLLMDDRLGRRETTRLGLSIVGILGVLLVAKQINLIPQVKPIIDSLINQTGFRVSSQLYERIITFAQEI